MAKVLHCYQPSIVYPFVNWEASEKEKKVYYYQCRTK